MVIGIVPGFDGGKYAVSPLYVEAVEAGGGLALILPYTGKEGIAAQMGLISGLLLTGGGDIEPALYGQQRSPKTEPPTPMRDEYELEVCRAALGAGIPVLGICRGCQLLNVALGGNMEQHVDNHVFNTPRRADYIHDVYITEGSRLAAIMGGTQVSVNSIHHQVVGSSLGRGLVVSAKSGDGLVEGIEHTGQFALGVQWHPEELAHKDKLQAALFSAFVQACKR